MPMYKKTDLECWSDCPDEEMQRQCACRAQLGQQVGGDPEISGGVAVIEDVRKECETGPLLFMGEIVCGANINPRDVA